jgi:hypothetical protein
VRSRRFVTGTSSERQPRPREPRLAAASLLLFGLIVGLVAGLYYTWVVQPVSYVASAPSRLSDEFKEEYILLVSQSYAEDADWERAESRLVSLDDPEIADTVSSQLEQYLREGRPAQLLNDLAVIAKSLGSRSQVVSLFVPLEEGPTQMPIIPTSTLLPTPTETRGATRSTPPTPTPTDEPTPTPVAVFKLLKKERICRRNTPIPLIEVVVYDAFLEHIQGVEVFVRWAAGSDHFYTGYHPDYGLGYGDFAMEPESIYSVELAVGSALVEGLEIESCGEEVGGFAGGWRLTFQITEEQPESSET